MRNPYVDIFRGPGTKGFAAAAFVARLQIAMAPIGIVAMLSQTHGEYWLAGAVSATYALVNAFLSPHVSRLVDRRGQTAIGVPMTLVSVLAFATLIIAANRHWPAWTLFGSALL
ncbi:MAG: MFS transporter, partial [Mesorhizobium sp.]